MTELLKNRYKLSLIMAVCFFIGIIASLYNVYSLPHKLMLIDGYQPHFTSIYIALAITFLLGGLSIWHSLQHRNEVIVYREKQSEKNLADQDTTETNKTTISLDSVRGSLQAGSSRENLQSGLHAICKQLDAGQGAIYLSKEENGLRKVELKAGYALSVGESTVIAFEYGEGLVGQAAAGARTLYVDEVPEGYVKIISGLGSASPKYLLIVPIKNNEQVAGVLEIASFTPISEDERKFVEESAQLIAGSITGK